LLPQSPAIDRGAAPPESHPLDREFRAPAGMTPRSQHGSLDLGAFEFVP